MLTFLLICMILGNVSLLVVQIKRVSFCKNSIVYRSWRKIILVAISFSWNHQHPGMWRSINYVGRRGSACRSVWLPYRHLAEISSSRIQKIFWNSKYVCSNLSWLPKEELCTLTVKENYPSPLQPLQEWCFYFGETCGTYHYFFQYNSKMQHDKLSRFIGYL